MSHVAYEMSRQPLSCGKRCYHEFRVECHGVLFSSLFKNGQVEVALRLLYQMEALAWHHSTNNKGLDVDTVLYNVMIDG